MVRIPQSKASAFPHPCACHRDPASPSPWAEKSPLAAQTRVGWIPVTSTGMREEGAHAPKKKALRGRGSDLARHSIRYRKPDGGVWREP
ncbi:hypothetical protein Ddc_21624 [Ditylenchus destructor]|nr:hypothetical protein Ddc_21624 [Ditylenchus destructor]